MSESRFYKIHEGDITHVGVTAIAGLVGSIGYGFATNFDGQPFGVIAAQNNDYNAYLDRTTSIQSHIDSLNFAKTQLGTASPKQLDTRITQETTVLKTLISHPPANHTGEVVGEVLAVPFVTAFTTAAIMQGICHGARKLGYRSGNLFGYWHTRSKEA